ncbi:transposase family protein [Kitasatospora aureofaciens]|uniref:transposase family protein n=1 Tax=Kitasatospora aureofaciens TaxID=1894 RepID=UPI000B0FBC29|nr:transposase family protein [Kitasatospora aureofaciens]
MLAGASSLPAVGEWIADAPPHVLERLGVRPDPVLPRRLVPAEATVRRLLARIDADALDRAVGGWLADRRPAGSGRPTGPARRRRRILAAHAHPPPTKTGRASAEVVRVFGMLDRCSDLRTKLLAEHGPLLDNDSFYVTIVP